MLHIWLLIAQCKVQDVPRVASSFFLKKKEPTKNTRYIVRGMNITGGEVRRGEKKKKEREKKKEDREESRKT